MILLAFFVSQIVGFGEISDSLNATNKGGPRILSEAEYKKRIELLETHFGTSNVHSLSKHGADTTGLQQLRRVGTDDYILPSGNPGNPTKNASKFLSHRDHYHALRSALVQQRRNGFQQDITVGFDRLIGVNFRNLGTHSNKGPFSAQYVGSAKIRFDPSSQKFFTAFPEP